MPGCDPDLGAFGRHEAALVLVKDSSTATDALFHHHTCHPQVPALRGSSLHVGCWTSFSAMCNLKWGFCCSKRRRLLTSVIDNQEGSPRARVVQSFNPLRSIAVTVAQNPAKPEVRPKVVAKDDVVSLHPDNASNLVGPSQALDEPRASYAPGASRTHHVLPPTEVTLVESSVTSARESRRRRSTRAERLSQFIEGFDQSAGGTLELGGTQLDSSCNAVLKLTKPADLNRVVPALQRMLLQAATDPLGQSAMTSLNRNAGPSEAASGSKSAEAIETLCRTLISVAQKAGGTTLSGTSAVIARAMATHRAHVSAMEQACWLVGDLLSNPSEMGGFLAEGGAQALVGILISQSRNTAGLTSKSVDAGDDSTHSTLVAASASEEPASASAVAQTLVAMCSVAADPRGSASLVAAGAVPAVVSALRDLAEDDAAVAEAGCHVIQDLLRVGPQGGASRREARRALVSSGGIEVLLQQLTSK